MMQQYMEIKEQHLDCILFFRLGDFYEMFGEDAQIASRELDLVLTTRDRTAPEDERTPMCGVPHHSAESYIARLIAKGHKVAICEQTEDPKAAKGLVKRDVVRIITPGTAIESSMLDEAKNNFLSTVWVENNAAGVAFCDLSTGEMYCTECSGDDITQSILNEIGRFVPSEAVLNSAAGNNQKLTSFLADRLLCNIERCEELSSGATAAIEKQFQLSITELGLSDKPCAISASAMLLEYLYETQKTDLSHIRKLDVYEFSRYMQLDLAARRNLELCETLRTNEKKGSLLWVLDKTETPMGGRLIRAWIEKPLLNPTEIERRLAAVAEFFENAALRDNVAASLKGISDIERIMGRIVYGTANGRDLRSLCAAARNLPVLRGLIGEAKAALLTSVREEIDELSDITALIDRAIVDEPPFSVREGGFIRKGYSLEVDELNDILSGGRGGVAEIEATERERTGIKTLKVGYNRVFGYYIEVRNSGTAQVPEHYIRKQTLADRERYITEELKVMEATILSASDKKVALEYELFDELRKTISAELHRIQRTAHAVAELDVLRAFAETAYREGYYRPTTDHSDRIEIVDGRHPVVEKMLSGGMFVPNDTSMDTGENLATIITGPNMAGKSTYMRQVALIVLMAQAGSFVPAKSAKIGVVDRIFTRIGASDDLAGGQSTFMVEMSEVAEILRSATQKSLLILDEIGRGTSTFDGMAIARAVLEWTSDKKRLGAKTLFATHYHELTVLEDQLTGVKNYNIAVKKRGRDIVFLRKIVRGGTDDSYGIEVARLAGIPDGVIARADSILASLEAGEPVALEKRRERAEMKRVEADSIQISMLDVGAGELVAELKKTDLNILTPIEAMNVLFELKKKAERL